MKIEIKNPLRYLPARHPARQEAEKGFEVPVRVAGHANYCNPSSPEGCTCWARTMRMNGR